MRRKFFAGLWGLVMQSTIDSGRKSLCKCLGVQGVAEEEGEGCWGQGVATLVKLRPRESGSLALSLSLSRTCMEYAEAKSVKSDLKACQTLAKRATERGEERVRGRQRGGKSRREGERVVERETATAHARS